MEAAAASGVSGCGGLLQLLAVGGAALLVYLLLGRRATGAAGSAFERREHQAGRPPADAWSPRLSGFPLRLCVHLANTAFGQLCLVPLLLRVNNFTILRRLDIPEDPTFLPVVAAEGKTDSSEPGSVSEILQKLLETSSHSTSKTFSFRQIPEYLDCYRSGEVTPLQVAKNIVAALEDAEKSSPPFRAIVQWDQGEILKMAEASTARYRAQKPLSLLDGVPVCLKEEIKVVPYRHRSGTEYLGVKPESEDATVARRLREAGAVIIGVSNMHELGTGTTGCNPGRHHGTPRNPYRPQHFTGGSSSGSAAAVAAGLCPLAIGTDGGGSVRIPASFCGIVGLKGTFGRISGHGCHPLSYSTVGLGPLCASVADVAIAYSILAGPDPLYPYGLGQPEPSLSQVLAPDLKGLKCGVDWTFFKACDAEVLSVCQKAVGFLESAGASVVDVTLPEVEEIRVAHIVCILSEMRDFLQPDFNNHFQSMGLNVSNETFLMEVLSGCIEYKPLLDVVVNAFYIRDGKHCMLSERNLYSVVCYLTTFRLEELGLQQFRRIVKSLGAAKICKFLRFFLSVMNLSTWIKDEWSQMYDSAYVTTNWIQPLLTWQPKVQQLIDQLEEKLANDVPSAEITEPKDFRLTVPNPRPVLVPELITRTKYAKNTDNASIKLNATAILREGVLYQRKVEQELNRFEHLLRGARDPSEFLDWQKQMRESDRHQQLAEAQCNRLRGKLSYEEAILARQGCAQKNQEKAEQERLEVRQ